MKLTVIVTTDEIDYDRQACSKVESLNYEYLHVKKVRRLVERTHYTYGEPVLIEMDVEIVNGPFDNSDEISDLEDTIYDLEQKINWLEDKLKASKHLLSSQEGEKA